MICFLHAEDVGRDITQIEGARILQHVLRHKWTNAEDSVLLMSAIAYLRRQIKEAKRTSVEEIAHYIESDSDCLMPIVVEETKHDYGVRLLKIMADEIRTNFCSDVTAR
jgi:uncharacterized protein YbgA (DUF1722 family)